MKIAYLVHLNLDDMTGVFKKIADQVRTWRQLGHSTKLFVITRSRRVAQALREAIPETNVAFYQSGSIRDRLYAFRETAILVERFSPSVIYLRRDLFYPPIYNLASSWPVAVEINSEELIELWLHNKAQWVYHLLTRPILDRRLKGMIFVTHELSKKGYYGRLRLPKEVIGNGIRLEDYPSLPVSKAPHLLFITGYPALWQGIDKVIFLAKQFPQWVFHGVGLTADDIPQLPRNVHCYGRLSLDEYLPIAAQACVGLGTLALHRKGLNEASPLKTREYLALGLPVIIGYQDTDFTGEEPFICRIPNSEDNVQKSLRQIEDFVTRWIGQRVDRKLVAHLDWRVKETGRLAFLKNIA